MDERIENIANCTLKGVSGGMEKLMHKKALF
jgi:hypothetical protein